MIDSKAYMERSKPPGVGAWLSMGFSIILVGCFVVVFGKSLRQINGAKMFPLLVFLFVGCLWGTNRNDTLSLLTPSSSHTKVIYP